MITDLDWLEYQSSQIGNKTAIISDESVLTYSNLNEIVKSAAGKFMKAGLSTRQYVPIISGHNVDFIIAVYALWRIGAVPVPISTRLNKREIDDIVGSLSASFCIADNTGGYSNSNLRFISTEQAGHKHSVDSGSFEFSIDNEALVLFTSGSTGKPKGVVLTFHSLYHSFRGIFEFDNYKTDDRILASLPLYHIGGFSTITRALLSGAQLILPEGIDYLSTAGAMSKYNPTIVSLVPTNLDRMLQADLLPNKSLRSLYLGGGESSNQLVSDAIDKGYPVIKVYGSTETCSMVSAVKVSDSSEYGSSGRELRGCEISIDSNSKKGVQKYSEGEIVVSSKSLFKYYFNNSSLTESVLRNGLYYTGDYGYLDSAGLLYVLSRRTDLIVSGGENISPAEVEAALLQIDGLTDCYVTGIKDKEWGQAVIAFIVKNDINTPDDSAIIKELGNQIASYKIPKRFIALNEIPRNSMGKIRRDELINIMSG